jgi:hypothetical protein
MELMQIRIKLGMDVELLSLETLGLRCWESALAPYKTGASYCKVIYKRLYHL